MWRDFKPRWRFKPFHLLISELKLVFLSNCLIIRCEWPNDTMRWLKRNYSWGPWSGHSRMAQHFYTACYCKVSLCFECWNTCRGRSAFHCRVCNPGSDARLSDVASWVLQIHPHPTDIFRCHFPAVCKEKTSVPAVMVSCFWKRKMK